MYRSAWWDNKGKCIKLRTWTKDGKRVSGSCSFRPYLFTESDSGQYRSIFGNRLEKREFDSPFDRTKFTKDFGSKHYYGNFDVNQQFLIDTFWNKVSDPDFAKNELRIIFYDIEVDPLPDNQFPVPELAKAEINIITAWDSLEKKYFIFSKYPYNGNDLIEGSVFIHCENERELLKKFIEFWQSNDYPDIVSGWNSNGFDFPYIRNRIIKVLGDSYFLALSPYGVIKEFLTVDKLQRELIKYDVAGVANLDYLDVYAKFKVAKQESYKLDFIAEQEIGYGKVDYEGMTIYEFMEKYWDRFVEYNVRDVELLVKLEEKLRYFRILRIVSNMACVNYDKGLTTIPITNGALAIRANARGEILHTFIRDVSDEKKPGGFCFSTPGFHRDIVTVDATSLYPSIIMSNNISPETKIGMCYFHDSAVDMYIGHNEDMLDLELTNGKRYTINRENLKKLIKQKDLILSANGCLFSQDKEGIFPMFIRDVFSKRVEAKNLMKKLQKENEKLEKKLKKASGEEKIKLESQIAENQYKIDQADILQYVYKILINSAYGALSSRKNPIGDDDIGNAITVMGSTSIQHVNNIVMEFVRGKMITRLEAEIAQNPGNVEALKSELDFVKTTDIIPDVLVANDTDSAMFSLSKCGVKICDGDIVTEEGYELVQECDDYINTEFMKWYEKLTNSHNCRLNFKREKICDAGIWLKKANSRKGENEEAKKNYVVHILDNEGVKHPKFKYTGVKFARSVIPADLKKEGKKIIENMLLTQDRQSTDRMVQKLYDYFCNMPIDTKAAIQRCKDIKKYDNGNSDTFILGTPGHVRAALNYNRVIKELKLSKYQAAKNGDIVKIVFVEPNKFGIERLAYLDTWPKEFDDHFKIDNKKMFENILFEEIKRFYKSVDWPSFNPTDSYAFSLFDLIEAD